MINIKNLKIYYILKNDNQKYFIYYIVMYFIIMRHLLKEILDQSCIIIKIVNSAIFIVLFILKNRCKTNIK